jgi:hypothetical protein
MEPAEQTLLVDLRRTRRSRRLQDMDEPTDGCAPDSRATDSGRGRRGHGIVDLHHRPERYPVHLDIGQPGGRDQALGSLPAHSSQSRAFVPGGLPAPVIMMSHNRQQDIDREAAENEYRINVKAELEIELLHEKIDPTARA